MTRYPTSDDMAALRRSIPQDVGAMSAPPFAIPPRHPRGDNAQCAAPGAFPDELRDGIGYRASGDSLVAQHDREHGCIGPFARREASALRSRAYARACVAASPGPCADCGAIGWHTRACRADWPALP